MTLTTTGVAAVELPRAERAAKGKAARAVAPRSSHAEFTRDPTRPAPLALLARQDVTRVPELLPIRYGRMAASPFAYFRGAALPMASDLAGTPASGLVTQLCGDAHLKNFGMFASPERQLVFDIDDFDETLPGPWEWDVKRLAASLEVAGRHNDFGTRERRDVVLSAVAEYHLAMREFAGRTALEVWYAYVNVDSLRAQVVKQLASTRRKNVERTLAKARSRDHLGAMARFVERVDGSPRIASDPPLVVRLDDLVTNGDRSAVRDVFTSYRASLEPERRALLDRYRVVDIARKVVGVGSVGTRCWMALLLGNDDQDPLFLQLKEAGPAVLEEFLGPSRYGNAGRRVVVGQRLMQTVSDIFLGWVSAGTVDFHVRQLRDWKGSVEVEAMDPPALRSYGRLCAWTLARAHARTGDTIAIASYLGSSTAFANAVTEFASTYADQNERDHATLREAIEAGRVAAE